METVDILRKKLECKDDVELGLLFNRSGSVVSVWRKKGLPPGREKRAHSLLREKGIAYDGDGTLPDMDSMTTEQKLKRIGGFTAKEIRYMLEFEKLSEEEQDAELKRFVLENLTKGRY